MSYSEENGQVVLRMSREDYDLLLMSLGMATGVANKQRIFAHGQSIVMLCDRLNEGNPNYTPYQVPEKKS